MPFPTVALCSTTKFLFTLHWLIHLVFVCSKHITKDSIANMNFMLRVRKVSNSNSVEEVIASRFRVILTNFQLTQAKKQFVRTNRENRLPVALI